MADSLFTKVQYFKQKPTVSLLFCYKVPVLLSNDPLLQSLSNGSSFVSLQSRVTRGHAIETWPSTSAGTCAPLFATMRSLTHQWVLTVRCWCLRPRLFVLPSHTGSVDRGDMNWILKIKPTLYFMDFMQERQDYLHLQACKHFLHQ